MTLLTRIHIVKQNIVKIMPKKINKITNNNIFYMYKYCILKYLMFVLTNKSIDIFIA